MVLQISNINFILGEFRRESQLYGDRDNISTVENIFPIFHPMLETFVPFLCQADRFSALPEFLFINLENSTTSQHFFGYISVDDGCGRRFTNSRCWWPIFHNQKIINMRKTSPTSSHSHQHHCCQFFKVAYQSRNDIF